MSEHETPANESEHEQTNQPVAIATPGDETLLYNPSNPQAWIQSDTTVELPSS